MKMRRTDFVSACIRVIRAICVLLFSIGVHLGFRISFSVVYICQTPPPLPKIPPALLSHTPAPLPDLPQAQALARPRPSPRRARTWSKRKTSIHLRSSCSPSPKKLQGTCRQMRYLRSRHLMRFEAVRGHIERQEIYTM
jgi:hypothetical protein